MVKIRNTSNRLLMVGERYLLPGASRMVSEELAAQYPGLVVGAGLVPAPTPAPTPAPDPAQEPPTEDTDHNPLREIWGIGPRIAEALEGLGIDTYAALIAADATWLAEALDGSNAAQVERWQAAARKKAGQD